MPRLSLGLGVQNIRKVGGTSAPFSPASLSGLSLWLKSNAGVTLSGSNVTAWADQSGSSAYCSPYDSAPIFISNSLNGYPVINLSPLDESSTRAFNILNSGSIVGETGTTAFAVMYVDDVCNEPNANGPVFGDFGGAGESTHMPYGLDCSVYDGFCSANRKGPLTAPNDIVNFWTVYSVVSTNNDWRNYINGDLMHSDNTNVYNDFPYDDGTFRIGIASPGGPYTFKGKVAEIVMYNRVLTNPQRQQVETYLNTKYAIY